MAHFTLRSTARSCRRIGTRVCDLQRSNRNMPEDESHRSSFPLPLSRSNVKTGATFLNVNIFEHPVYRDIILYERRERERERDPLLHTAYYYVISFATSFFKLATRIYAARDRPISTSAMCDPRGHPPFHCIEMAA